MRVPLVITRAHIKDAEPGCPTRCVVARAIEDQYDVTLAVGGFGHIYNAESVVVGSMSLDLQNQIISFDDSRQFDPGVYFIDLPIELASK